MRVASIRRNKFDPQSFALFLEMLCSWTAVGSKVPWRVINWELTAARSVLRSMVSLFNEAPDEVSATCKKDK